MKQRLMYIDALKGFAIFLVVWGHCLQYLDKQADYLHNPLFELIYAFHMPLFFFISGMFFSSSLKLMPKEFIRKKFNQLLLPCITWAILIFLANQIAFHFMGKWFLQGDTLYSILLPSHWPFWFLKELFISYVLVYAAYKTVGKEWAAVAVSLAIVLLMPYGTYQRFLLPIFWAGLFFRRHQDALFQNAVPIMLASGGAFLVSLYFWNGSYTSYFAGFPRVFELEHLRFNFFHIGISLFRMFIGLAGSLFFFFLFKQSYRPNFIFNLFHALGAYTLGIYILQSTLLENLINRWVYIYNLPLWIYSLVVTPIVAVAVVFICVVLIRLIAKNKKVEFLLLGSAYSDR